MPGRLFVAGVDDSETSMTAAIWAALNLATRPGDALHLLFTLPPPTFYAAPTGPWPAAGAAAFGATLAQKEEDEHLARATLARVKRQIQAQAPEVEVHTHALPAAGGASGLGESIVVWAQEKQAAAIVLGSRGMGAVKSTLMSLAGLGSVSHYCMHHSKLPVAIVRGREGDRQKQSRCKVMVAVDDSDVATKALLWAVQEVVGPSDEVHLVSVALPVPYPAEHEAFLGPPAVNVEEFEAEYRGSLRHSGEVTERAAAKALHAKIVGDDAIAAHVAVAAELESTMLTNLQYAEQQAQQAGEAAAAAGVDKAQLFVKALTPEGGASDVGAAIARYAAANGVDVLVVGARGMGAVKRALMGFIGLGSVSDYLSRHVECPVVVVKE